MADRVADMTIEELRQLIREAVSEALEEFFQESDPALLAEFAAREAGIEDSTERPDEE